MHLLLCPVVDFGCLMVGLCARLGTVNRVWSINGSALKYFKGCAYQARREDSSLDQNCH